MNPIIEMISTGDEVLSGLIVDSNAAWLARTLLDEGLEMSRRSTVGDELSALIDLFNERSLLADIIIVNGGLGPTEDDLTAEAAAKAANLELVEDSRWLEELETFYRDRGRVMPVSNRKQALLPEGAKLIDNPCGTACGFSLKLNRATLFFTPGVPSEFFEMIEHQILPAIRQQSELTQQTRLRRYYSFGLSESWLSDQFKDHLWPEGVTLGYRSDLPTIELKLIARGLDDPKLALDQSEAFLAQKLGHYLMGSGDTPSMGGWFNQQLDKHSVCVIENFSGGLLTQALSEGEYLKHGSWLPALPVELEQLASLARQQFSGLGCQYLLLVGTSSLGRETDGVSIALVTREQFWGKNLRIGRWPHPLMQQLITMAAQDLLRRHLQNAEVLANYHNLETLDSLELCLS
ncbi:CinA family nicotinamide mononucleotide deamidase-related protein [Dongshaea marina]|uniref:CinA family nicotinamide mononucleotide deamidase-related protein n=1 Tax=Dongshaea marina TaxID=2047966 RepID=UPI000D3EA153|nr:CinA family nicotinamide mononucleotide deamidase-related protein [Dongshaea marina]